MMDLLNWVAALGGTTVLLLVLIAAFAPGLVAVATEWLKALTPFIRGVSEGIVWLAKGAWIAIKDIADNVYTVIFVVALAAFVGFSASGGPRVSCEKCIQELRKEYKFVPRTKAEKKAYQNKVNPPQWWEFWRL